MIRSFTKMFFPHDHKQDHFKALDGLRGIAILLVLVSHASGAGWMFLEHLNFTKAGKIGVFLFFVLSAYLLDRQIAIALISKKSSKLYWLNYLLRRFLRIYPLFFIALLAHLTLTLIGYETVITSFKDIVNHLLLLDGKNIFWSIPVEFKYYFLSPVLMFIAHKFLNWKIKTVVPFLFTLAALALFLDLRYSLSNISTVRYLPIFLTGTLFSIYDLVWKKENSLNMNGLMYNIIALLCFLGMLLTVPYYFNALFQEPINFHESPYFLWYALFWTGVLICAKYGKGAIKMFLELKILRFFGTISYSAYLLHKLILIPLINTTMVGNGFKFYIFMLATTFISMLSYLVFERPLSKIKIYKKPITEKSIYE